MKKVSTKTYILQRVLDYVGVAFLGVLLLFIWQLYRGPIEVPFLKPYIMQALNQDNTSAELSLDSVSIELVRSLQPIKIVAKDISYKKNDDTLSVKAPRTTVSFSLKALLRGVIAPSSVAVEKPEVYVFTNYGTAADNKNDVDKKKLGYYFKQLDDFLEKFNSEDNTYAESYISKIKIIDGSVELHEVDLGRKWSFSDVNYTFSRNLLNMSMELNALVNLGDTLTSVGWEGEYRQLGKKLAMDFYFSDLHPNSLADTFLDKTLSNELYRVNLPISGRLSALIDVNEVLRHRSNIADGVDDIFEKLRFQLEGGQGNIMFDQREDSQYKISSFLLEGEVEGGLDKISIENAAFDLGEQQTKISVDVKGFKNYLLERSLNDLQIRLTAAVDEFPVDKLYEYWPKYIAEPAWNWCHESLFGGTINDAAFTFSFGYDKEKEQFAFLDLVGKGDVRGTSLDYLTGMPRINEAYGHAAFSTNNIKIDVDKGVSEGVELVGGYVNLYDLDKNDNFADISLQIKSNVSDALKMIDNDPLKYTSDMGLNPNSVKGSAITDLGLKFELKQNLAPDEVHVNVESDISNFEMADVFQGKSVTAEQLKLHVDNNGLSVKGDAVLDAIPISLDWTENFQAKDYRSRYNVGFVYNEALKKKIGINDVGLLNPPYINGNADMKAEITIFDDSKTNVKISGNLNAADIDFSFLGFKKDKGEKGNISAVLNIENNQLASVPSFSLSKQGFSLDGGISLDKQGNIRTIDIKKIRGAKTFAKAKIDLSYQPETKVKINITGNSYDLSPFFEKTESKIKVDKKSIDRRAIENDDDDLEKTVDTDIYIAVDNLWTNPDIPVTNFAGSAKLRNGTGIEEIHMVGNYKDSQNAYLKFDYVPRQNKEFYLSVDSNDAGAALKVLRVYDNMKGGRLKIEARRNKEKTFVGHAKIRKFSIYNTPLVAKFLTVASFRGMLDLLTGEGLGFSHFDAPFEYKNKQLMLKKAKAFGDVIGVTANGTFDRRFEELDIRGQVAPAYSLNMILGSIPLVGNLLAGKDGTVFAADYSISGDIADASIKINPLSALSPNSLKETISSLFGSDE